MNDTTMPRLVTKAAGIGGAQLGEADMAAINALALTPLDPSQVFAFKVMAADNEADDRNFAPFDRAALDDLAALYPGRPLIKDHERSADNQVGRVYAAEVIEDAGRTTYAGEPHAELVLRAYMLRTASNADLIAEIEGGVKREASTSCSPAHAYCSVCGADNVDEWCPHVPGETYDTDEGEKACLMRLSGATDAYELSLVAVPSQPRAGVTKPAFAKPPRPQVAQDEAARVVALLASIELEAARAL